MRAALELADEADRMREVPVGAVVVQGGQIVGCGANGPKRAHDPSAHAEILALRQAAGKLGNYRLPDCTVYATLEPCAMCAGALVNSRVERLVFAAPDPKGGFCGSLGDLVRDARLNHRLEVRAGVGGERSAALLRRFFARLR